MKIKFILYQNFSMKKQMHLEKVGAKLSKLSLKQTKYLGVKKKVLSKMNNTDIR